MGGGRLQLGWVGQGVVRVGGVGLGGLAVVVPDGQDADMATFSLPPVVSYSSTASSSISMIRSSTLTGATPALSLMVLMLLMPS